jgi:exopolysaccharide biosynthesis WecB/TagA/CpsF family protein
LEYYKKRPITALAWALGCFVAAFLERRDLMLEDRAQSALRDGRTLTVPDGRIFVYGGRTQGELVQFVINVRQRYPDMRIVGGYSPPFRKLSSHERDAIAAEINRAGADLVWVALGPRKEETSIADMRPRLNARELVRIDAAFDWHAGLRPMAPSWVRSVGLKGFYRAFNRLRRRRTCS